jgi:hypothetical protein
MQLYAHIGRQPCFKKWQYEDVLQVHLCFLDYYRGSLDHGLSLNNIAPSMIWMCSFIDYLSLNTIVSSSLIHHLIIFHWPLADLNTDCFSFSRSTVLPPAAPLFKKCQCHFYQGFCKLDWCSSCLTIFLIRESLSYFKDHAYSKSSLMYQLKADPVRLSWKKYISILSLWIISAILL